MNQDKGDIHRPLGVGPELPVEEVVIRRQNRSRQARAILSEVTKRAPVGEQLAPRGQERLVLYYCANHYHTFVALANLAKRLLILPRHMAVDAAYSAFLNLVNEVPQYIVETVLLDPLPPLTPEDDSQQEKLRLYTLDLTVLPDTAGTHGGRLLACVGAAPHLHQPGDDPSDDFTLVGVLAIVFAASLVGLEATDPKVIARVVSHLKACGTQEGTAEEIAPIIANTMLVCGRDCAALFPRIPTAMKAIICSIYTPTSPHRTAIFTDPTEDQMHHVNREYNVEASQFIQVGYVLKKGGLTSINLIRKMILSPIGRAIIPRHYGFIEDSERLYAALNQLLLDVEQQATPPFEPYLLMARLFLPRESLMNLSIDKYPNLSALTDTLMKRVGEAGHLSSMMAYVGFDRARGAASVTAEEIQHFYTQALGRLATEEQRRAVLDTLNRFQGLVDDES